MNTVTIKKQRKTQPKTINVRRVMNPFEPLRDVRVEQWVWKKKKTLAQYLPVGLTANHVISRNGAVVMPDEFATTTLDADDYVVVCPVPLGGGGGGKMVLRVVAMVAIAVASVYTGGLAASAYTGMASASAAAAAGVGGTFAAVSAGVAAAVTVAGSMLVNALLPPAQATNNGGSIANSSSYGADGAKNTSTEGIAVPVNYGSFRMAGNIIGLYTENNVSGSNASNNGNNQILYMLINAGEGPIASISDVLINDRPADEFLDVTIQTRLGYSQQAPIDWFSKIISPVNKNIKLPDSGDFVNVSTIEPCEQFRLDFVCPSGLYTVDSSSGSINNNTVALEVDYRVADSGGEWIPLGPTKSTYKEFTVTPVTAQTDFESGIDGNFPITSLTIANVTQGDNSVLTADRATIMAKYGQYVGQPLKNWPAGAGATVSTVIAASATTGNLTITDNLRAAVRRSFYSPQLTMARYEMRVRRNTNYVNQTVNNATNQVHTDFPTDTSQNSVTDTYLSDVNEIRFDGVGYNNTALLALRVQMDDQLSGVPSVSFMHGGKLAYTYSRNDGVVTASLTAPTNPAWIWYDMATNPIYGAGLSASRIDLDSVLAWAAYCDAQGLTWNGPLDQIQNFWDASALVMRVGHAQGIQVGTRYYIATEAPSDPVMMFGMGNIIKDTFQMTWLGQKDRATEIDITYFDKTDYNKSKTVKVQDASMALTGAQQNVSAITLYGVDNIKTAYQEGAFQLNLNKYLTTTVQFDAPLEAIACTVGDVVLVQHDMPDWSFSGRLEAGSTVSTLKLDKPVTMAAGATYKALLLTNYVVRTSTRIQAVIGNFVQLQGGSGVTEKTMRIRAGNGTEAAVLTLVPDGVYVDDVTGFVAGDTCQLFDTDVVTDVNVLTQPGTTDTLSLSTPLGYAPAQFTNYMFGEATKVKKTYRIKSITLATSPMNRTISALEYNPAVYDLSNYSDVIETLQPPLLDPAQAAIGQVTNLAVYEETYVSGTIVASDVRATWSTPMVGSYAGADVYVQINGGAFTLAGSTINGNTSMVIPGVVKGQQIVVKVVAYDLWGKRAAYEAAPMAGYTVVGQVTGITVATVSGVDYIWAGRDCKLFWHYNSVTGSYEFGSEANGADDGARDPHFLDYQIQVFDPATNKLLRTDHTTDNSYIYTYEKNFADGLHRNLRFELAARDIFNHVGAPAVIDAYNPPPQVVSVNDNPSFDRVQIDFTHTDDTDYAGAMIYLAWMENVTMDPKFLAYDGPDTSVLLNNLMFNSDYNFIIAPYDAFGKDELLPSIAFHFRTPYMDVEAIAEGVLKDSQLIPELQTRINLVDAPASIIGSVNERLETAKSTLSTASALALTTAITAEQTLRQTATDSLAQTINGVSAATNANGAAIQSEQTARSAADSALGTRVDTVVATAAGNTAAIVTEQTTRASADGALSTRIDTLASNTGVNTAAITTETNARTTADSALSTRLDLVSANTGSNTAAVQTEAAARTAADSALATQITTVAASFGVDPTNLCSNPVGTNGTTGWSAVTVLSKTVSDVPAGAPTLNVFKQNQRDNLFSGRIVDVTPGQQHYLEVNAATPVAAATFTLGLRLLTASGSAAFVSAATLAATKNWTRISGPVTIPAGYVQAQLWTNINIAGTDDNNRWYFTDAEWRPMSLVQPAMAAISTEQTARASADGALSTRIDSVNASLGTTNANVQTETNARVAADSANASSITQVQANLNNYSVSVSQAFSATNSNVGGLQAQYTVKIDNNGYVSGFGLASYPVGSGIVSEFAVRADTFSVQLPGYSGVHPFTIGAVYGVPRVIISNALIGDASIDNAKIGDAQITAAKIANANILTAHIGVAQIDTLRIGANAVSTMASWGGQGDPVYYASGGDILVFLSANLGMYNSSTGGNEVGTANVTMNGNYLAISNDRGDRACSFMRLTGLNGAFTVSIRASGSNVSNVQTAVFEAKR